MPRTLHPALPPCSPAEHHVGCIGVAVDVCLCCGVDVAIVSEGAAQHHHLGLRMSEHASERASYGASGCSGSVQHTELIGCGTTSQLH